MEITFDLNVLLAFGVFITPVSVVAIRHYIKKSRCFTILEQKVQSLESHDVGSVDEHDGFEERLGAIEMRQQKNEIYLKLLLDHNNIKYD